MKNDFETLAELSNIPVSKATLASLFPEIKAENHKVTYLEQTGKVIRLKKGLYVVSPKVSKVLLSLGVIANHLYSPSYVSMHWALRFYGLIPEAVYLVTSMTTKHARSFDTTVGRFDYIFINSAAFPIGVVPASEGTNQFLIATPEKALCDLIANSRKVNLRYLKEVEGFLSEDLRMEMDEFLKMDVSIFKQYAAVGKKASSIQTLVRYLEKYA